MSIESLATRILESLQDEYRDSYNFIGELIPEYAKRFPDLPEEDIRKALRVLANLGFVKLSRHMFEISDHARLFFQSGVLPNRPPEFRLPDGTTYRRV